MDSGQTEIPQITNLIKICWIIQNMKHMVKHTLCNMYFFQELISKTAENVRVLR
jgi:hypothetical protein